MDRHKHFYVYFSYHVSRYKHISYNAYDIYKFLYVHVDLTRIDPN